ncbi:hypothetical protein PVA45_02690 [Entomospira entomophila]|uniref:Lipoprotein n=1 Tax=Entomospira entomophila TaxID=2719988 RepID=A0A968GBP1_9SPIO|nr:hypothetical protein [Entomospira entomophilus]NIZ40421.1 hypothetical protein [Entomospira entomophilus]WDI35979.1 hypothetical protein PVA45_02690 [Entomospira entomophilus]
MMIKREFWRIMRFFLIIVSFISCQAQGRLHITDGERGTIRASIEIESDIHTIMMQYLEDADLLFDHPVADDIVPSSLQDMLGLIRPYVDIATIDRPEYHRIHLLIQVNDLESSTHRLRANQFGFVQFHREQRLLRLQMSAWERKLLYDSIPNLPEIPAKWNKASRKKYIDELANMFGSTKKEREALQKAFNDASIVLKIDGVSSLYIETVTGRVSHKKEVRLSFIDFMLGEDWIEFSW